jgi:release factor glutamine methyltransferase
VIGRGAILPAELLLSAALGIPRFALLLEPPPRVPREARRRFLRMVRARASHEPVAYLVGHKEFRGLEFRVDDRVLVPRAETETLAEAAIGWLLRRRLARPRVLDLGCGSGCLAVSIAVAVPSAVVVATDVSARALEVARKNVERLAEGRVTLEEGDLFQAVAGEAPFDLVVSNPPYVATHEDVDPGVLLHEPRRAWLAGDDPIAFHRRILDEAGAWLARDGALMLEVGSGATELRALAESREPGARVSVLADLAGRARVVAIER